MSAPSETTHLADHWTTIAGCRIGYREAGVGRPLVHLHGAGGPSWDEAHAILATRFRVIVPALPGFGESTRDPGVDSLPALARVVAGFIGEVVGEATHVLGSSFGGRVAAWLALEEPAILDRLVLESPASFPQRGGTRLDQISQADLRTNESAPDRGVEQFASQEARSRNVTAIGELTRGNPPEEELLARIHEIQTPTLVLFGTEDRLVPPETGRIYKERLTDCSFALVYQAGHVIRRDRPDAFTRLVIDFLERGPAFLVNRG